MSVLAFDTGRHTGWAFFANPRVKPELGTFEISARKNVLTDYGGQSELLLLEAFRLIRQFQPTIVAFESPIFAARDRAHTRRLLIGFANAIELAAHRNGIRCVEAHEKQVKRALTGNSRASKKQMIEAANYMGFAPADEHQADACGVALAIHGHLWTQRHLELDKARGSTPNLMR